MYTRELWGHQVEFNTQLGKSLYHRETPLHGRLLSRIFKERSNGKSEKLFIQIIHSNTFYFNFKYSKNKSRQVVKNEEVNS